MLQLLAESGFCKYNVSGIVVICHPSLLNQFIKPVYFSIYLDGNPGMNDLNRHLVERLTLAHSEFSQYTLKGNFPASVIKGSS